MIGQTVSHYRIIEKLGEGGMGVVYKAEDTKLKRQVALKFLPAELTRDSQAKNRFFHEARAAAALNHPHIITVYEIGEHEGQVFIAMEYAEGRTLKDVISVGTGRDLSLPVTQVIDIATQIAEGLKKAHAKGIVHRDLKPANVMLTDEESAKIVDFGLAKLKGQTRLTRTGTTLGTVAYMSPEQAMGKEVDQRTDIWSLGVILYEMLAGRLPFGGDYDQAVVYSILNESPRSVKSLRPETPPALEKIIGRCLEKDLAKRYQRMDEVMADMRAVPLENPPAAKTKKKATKLTLLAGAGIAVVALAILAYLFLQPKPAPPGGQSIAVLPFVDMSPQKDQEYFCDGMTEELINRLSKIQALRVPARTSAFFFKGKTADIREVGSKLNVETVLEGSVQKAGERLRITAQLDQRRRRVSPLVREIRPQAGGCLRDPGRDLFGHRRFPAVEADVPGS